MFKKTHINVASRILDEVQSNLDWKVNRTAYLIGSIAPDINCVYPTHTLNNTINRFRNKLNKVDNTNSNIIKSFTLGVITHYICDYFCYAHNLKHNNPKHAIYERVMMTHVKMHMDSINYLKPELIEQWKEIEMHIIEEMSQDKSIEDILLAVSLKGMDHIEYIVSAVKDMHNIYLDRTSELDTNNWSKSIPKIELDMEYSLFMCRKVIELVSNPKYEMECLIN